MKKKNLIALCGCTLLSLSAFACGGGGGVEVDTDLPVDDPSSPVTITFWHCLGQEKTKNLDKIVETFNAKYQGKYKVVADKLAGDYDSLHDTIKTRLASNEVPALAMGYPDSFAEYIGDYMDESFILRLDNFINDETFGYKEDELNDFVEQFLKEGQNYQFEGTWSMPMYKSTEIAYYNENYFSGDNPQTIKLMSTKGDDINNQYKTLRAKVVNAQASPSATDLKALKDFTVTNGGYTYEVPVTWDEMIELGRDMISDRNEQGIKEMFFPIGYDSDANMYISQFAQRGIDYTINNEESANDPSKHYLFNNPEAKEFVSEVISLVKEKVLITKGSLGGQKYTNEYFTAGQAAFVIGSTGGSSYNVSSNFKVSLAPVPYENEPKYIMQGPSISFFNNNDPYVHKGAWLFYKEMAEPTNNVKLALENSYDPIRNSSFETDIYKEWISKVGKGIKYDIPAATQNLRDKYITSAVFKGSSKAREEIGNLTTYIANNGMSIDDAFTTAFNNCARQ